MSSAITVSGLVKGFGPRTRALDHLDLRVESGEVHGFLAERLVQIRAAGARFLALSEARD